MGDAHEACYFYYSAEKGDKDVPKTVSTVFEMNANPQVINERQHHELLGFTALQKIYFLIVSKKPPLSCGGQ